MESAGRHPHEDLDPESLHKLKVDELKSILKERSVPFNAKDKKADLIQKLKEVLESEAQARSTAQVPASNETDGHEANGGANSSHVEAMDAVSPSKPSASDDNDSAHLAAANTENTDREELTLQRPVDKPEEKAVIVDDNINQSASSETQVGTQASSPPSDTAATSVASEENRLRELALRQQLTARVRSPRPNPDRAPTTRPPTCNVRVDNLQRPWQLRTLQRYLNDSLGTNIADSDIWTNAIKTHAYITFGTVQDSEKCIAFLAGKRYPETNNTTLTANYTDVSAAQAPSSSEAQLKPGEWLKSDRSTVGSPGGKAPALQVDTDEAAQPSATAATSPRTPTSGNVLNRLGAGGGLLRRAVVDAADSTKAAPLLGAGADRLRQNIKDRIGEPTKRKMDEDNLEEADDDRDAGDKKRSRLAGKAVAREQTEEEVLTLDDLFRKTEALPSLYWIPVSEEEASRRKALKEKYQGDPDTSARSTLDFANRNNAGGPSASGNSQRLGMNQRTDRPHDARPPFREFSGSGRDRGRDSRDRGRVFGNRDRSRDRDRPPIRPELAKYGPPPRR
jgi:hypothetical protein